MFRLNREWLGNPCDFCTHNKSPQNYFGTQLFAFTCCDKLEISTFPEASSRCRATKLISGPIVLNMHCPCFELSIPRLENAVYNKKQFSLTMVTVCILNDDGSWSAATDPISTVIQSAKAWMACKSEVCKPKLQDLKRLLLTIQRKYVAYRKLDLIEQIGVACGLWVLIVCLMKIAPAANKMSSKEFGEIGNALLVAFANNCGWFCSEQDMQYILKRANDVIKEYVNSTCRQ